MKDWGPEEPSFNQWLTSISIKKIASLNPTWFQNYSHGHNERKSHLQHIKHVYLNI